MATLAQVSNDDIKELKDFQLVSLLWQLVNLELSTYGIEQYDSHIPLSIYIKDGGIDGQAKWEGGPTKTAHLPCRHVGFQAKATRMNIADCAKEVKTEAGLLKPEVQKLFDAGGEYVLFLGDNCVEKSKKPRIAAFVKAIQALSVAAGTPIATPTVRIFDATDIATWVNMYPAAVSAVGYFLGRTYGVGMGWTELSGRPDWQFPYITLDAARVTAMQAIRSAAGAAKNVVRVVGLTGLGKTRLVFESFRPPPDKDPASSPEQARLASLFYYIDAGETDNVAQLFVQWRRTNRKGVVVVDDCPHELHEKLCQEVRRADSSLTLISIGNDGDANAYAGTDTKLLVVDPTTDDAIEAQLAAAFDDLPIRDRKFIAAELAQGYPQMAILVAQARQGGAPLAARLTPDVIAKLLGREVPRGSAAEKVISACSLFEYVGIRGEVEHEREFIRALLCPTVTADDFYANIVEFQKSGALSQYGRFVQVRPKPLAIRLAAEWWERCSPELAATVVEAKFPEGLGDAFCARLRMLDFVPALADTTARLCSATGPFGQAKVLTSKLGSQLFRAIAEVNPLAAVGAMSRLFGSYSDEQLLGISDDSRRNMVLAMEKLCFRAETFSSAAPLLARLAANENESWSNNSTGAFKRLFMILSSGTQAPLEQRLPILQIAANSPNPTMRSVAVTALENAIRTQHFSGMSGPELQGSGGPLPEYRPKQWKEVFDYWTSCLNELVALANSNTENSETAATAIATNIRGLIQFGRLDDVESAVQRVAGQKQGVWPNALDSIKDSLRYEGKSYPDGARARVESWLKLLEPDTLTGRLALHVTQAPYEHDESEGGDWRDLAAERAQELGVKCARDWPNLKLELPVLMQGNQRQAYMFGKGLAQGSAYSDEEFKEILMLLERVPSENRNSAIVAGWLAALDLNDSSRVDAWFHTIGITPKLGESLPSICRGISLNDSRVHELVQLLRREVIGVKQLRGLSNGKAMASVSPPTVAALCHEILKTPIDGPWIALDIAHMFVYSDGAKMASLAPTLKTIVSSPGMLSSATRESPMDAHAFERIAVHLLKDDPELAANLTREIIDTAAETSASSNLEHCIRTVLESLMTHQIDVAWPLFSTAMARSQGIAHWRITELMRRGFARDGEPSALGRIPETYLIQWCKDEPHTAPIVLAGIAEILVKGKGAKWELTGLARFLLDSYGSDPALLRAMRANLNTFSWAGSMVPFYQRQVEGIASLTTHHLPDVRHWAEEMIMTASQQVSQEMEKDAEQKVGRY